MIISNLSIISINVTATIRTQLQIAVKTKADLILIKNPRGMKVEIEIAEQAW